MTGITPDIWIGLDPGGKENFGLAVIHKDGLAATCCVNCAEEAIVYLQNLISASPSGIGIDAPLWWSSGPGSERKADKYLRALKADSGKKLLQGGAVQTANSLRGAALVQAAMFTERARQVWSTVPVTECHPKALLRAAYENSWQCFCAKHQIENTVCETDHERDAIIGAIAAREGFSGRWTKDLSEDRFPTEQNPKAYWLAPVHYFWPE